MAVTVKINASDVIAGVEEMQAAIEIANISVVARIREGINSIIREGVDAAFEEARLPLIYQEHLLQSLNQFTPEVIDTGDGIVVNYFDPIDLTDYAVLEEGFHYHALIDVPSAQFKVSNPLRVELPYGGEPLENPQEERYDFWKAVVAGTPYTITLGGGVNPLNGKRTPKHDREIPTAGLYEETLRARVNWWGNRYPEWLLLEYGQDFEPSSPATHFRELLETRVTEYMYATYEAILDSIVAVWNAEGVTRNSVGQLIDEKTGRFVKYLPR